MESEFDLTLTFPDPPESMLQAVALLQVARRGDPDEMQAHGLDEDSDLARPWEPALCPGNLRRDVWRWCHDVAQWINHEYVWRPQELIPACWSQHPHVAHELPIVAYLRWTSGGALSPEALDDWHRHTLPAFFERTFARLGKSSCLNGTHQPWPAASRYRQPRISDDDAVAST